MFKGLLTATCRNYLPVDTNYDSTICLIRPFNIARGITAPKLRREIIICTEGKGRDNILIRKHLNCLEKTDLYEKQFESEGCIRYATTNKISAMKSSDLKYKSLEFNF